MSICGRSSNVKNAPGPRGTSSKLNAMRFVFEVWAMPLVLARGTASATNIVAKISAKNANRSKAMTRGHDTFEHICMN